ncbi:DUF3040 domain-containing protein [Streptomyces lunalinharesii]|uniref:DUF3040 domain-containing protein n=1 Tax=Streptomyces lunalinharesii TaxID=333384 RepID=A0ABN3RNL9_9ACTN
MTEALSRRERFLLAQMEQDLRGQDAELDRRLTTMRWDDVPPPPAPPPDRHGCCTVSHLLGAALSGLLGAVRTAATVVAVPACTTVWGLLLACLARLVGRCARPRSADQG